MPVREYSREQAYLLPPSLDDWLPSDHPVRYVAEFVDALEPDEWRQMGIDLAGAATGAPGYHRKLLISVWLAGFMTGIRSSRGLERACRDQVSFRWLTGNQVPDHNTLWRFYYASRQGMRLLLKTTVRTARQAGLIELVLLAIDGTKVAGNAARDRTHDLPTLQEMEQRLTAAITELEAINDGDDDDEPPRLPKELQRAQALREQVRQALTVVQAENGPRQANLTDPDTRFHKARQGYVTGYNAQAAVMAVSLGPEVPAGLLVTAADVTTARDDHQQLVPMLAASTAALGQAPAVVAADGGYHSGATLAACAARDQVVVMPETQSAAQTANPYHKQHFTYDSSRDTYTCPQGQTLTFRGEQAKGSRPRVRIYRASATACRVCPAFGQCTTNQRQGRSLAVTPDNAAMDRHRAWMQTEQAQALADQRKLLVEPAFGIVKEQQGLRRFLVRGLENVTAEWSLLAVAFNLRTLARAWSGHGQSPPPTPEPTPHAPAPDTTTHASRAVRLHHWAQTHIPRLVGHRPCRPALF